jgi:hypothetical protein
VRTKYKKYIDFLERFFPLIWILCFIAIILSISFSTNKIQIFKLDASEIGWNHLIAIFNVPFSFLLIGIPIYGIILALKRIHQTEDQLKLLSNNIHLNNYYKHMDEFIKTIIYFRDSYNPPVTEGDDLFDSEEKFNDFKERLSTDFIRRLYIKWYGNEFKSNYKIKEDIHNDIRDLYKCIGQYRREMEIIELIKKLGFKSIFIDTGFIYKEIHWIFNVCERALEFSDQTINKAKNVRKYFHDL